MADDMIIGLWTQLGGGKGVVANHLAQKHGFIHLKFGEAIYRICEILGIPSEIARGNAAQRAEIIPWLGVSTRHVQQTLGTDWGRDMIHPDIWVRAFLNDPTYLKAKEEGRSVVVDNVRFPNEWDLIKQEGGFVVRINPGWKLGEGPSVVGDKEAAHISESALADYEGRQDYSIKNDSSIEALTQRVDEAVNLLRRRQRPGS